MAHPVPIFTKLTNPQQYYVQISYTGFYPKGTVNVQLWTEIYIHLYVICDFQYPNFHETHTY